MAGLKLGSKAFSWIFVVSDIGLQRISPTTACQFPQIPVFVHHLPSARRHQLSVPRVHRSIFGTPRSSSSSSRRWL